jgi:predicted transcriptional regulator
MSELISLSEKYKENKLLPVGEVFLQLLSIYQFLNFTRFTELTTYSNNTILNNLKILVRKKLVKKHKSYPYVYSITEKGRSHIANLVKVTQAGVDLCNIISAVGFTTLLELLMCERSIKYKDLFELSKMKSSRTFEIRLVEFEQLGLINRDRKRKGSVNTTIHVQVEKLQSVKDQALEVFFILGLKE